MFAKYMIYVHTHIISYMQYFWVKRPFVRNEETHKKIRLWITTIFRQCLILMFRMCYTFRLLSQSHHQARVSTVSKERERERWAVWTKQLAGTGIKVKILNSSCGVLFVHLVHVCKISGLNSSFMRVCTRLRDRLAVTALFHFCLRHNIVMPGLCHAIFMTPVFCKHSVLVGGGG